MSTLRASSLTLVAILALAVPALAADSTCTARCTPPKAGTDPRVEVDANTGKVVSGRTRFPADTQVEVVIVNKNPYKYSYAVDVDERNLELDLIRSALLSLGILDENDALKAPATTTAAAAPAAATPGATPKCGGLENVFEDAEKEATKAGTAQGDIVTLINTLKDDAKQFNAFLASVQTDPTAETCATRCEAAAKLRPRLDRLADREAMETLQDAADDAIRALNVDVELLERDRGVMSAECRDRLDELGKRRDDLLKLRTVLADAVAGLPDLAKKAAAAGELLDAIAADPAAFVSVRYLTARPEPTEFTIKITRKERETGSSTAVTVAIQVGRSRFSTSAGIGVGFVGQRTFARRGALVPDGSGGTKLGSVFAIDQEADETLGPALQLNGIFASTGQAAWGWSLGVTTQQGAKTSDLGYYTGPSVALIGDNLVFTLGYFRQSIDSLAGGFHLGDPVPDDLQDPLPTTSKTKGGLLIGVSYRIK